MPSEPDHVVIVTGAAGGIGIEIVRQLLVAHKSSVIATDLGQGDLGALAQEHPERIRIVLGNIVDPDISQTCVQTAIQTFGKLSGVCLNAGVFGPCLRLGNSSVEKWKQAFEVNVLSHLHMLQYALPELRKTKGRITATTSGAGRDPLFAGWGFYGMSKASVAFLIKQIALEEPEVTAVGISPGLCDTKMVAGLLTGAHEGWGAEDVKKYEDFTSQIELITPKRAAHAFATAVTKVDHELSGRIVDYDDPRLPTDKEFQRKSEQQVDYTAFSLDTKAS